MSSKAERIAGTESRVNRTMCGSGFESVVDSDDDSDNGDSDSDGSDEEEVDDVGSSNDDDDGDDDDGIAEVDDLDSANLCV